MWWTLMSESFSSLFWGLMIAVGGVFLAFFLIRICSPDRRLVPVGYLALAGALILLFIQATLFCAALRVRNLVGEVETRVSSIVSSQVGIVGDNLSQSDAGKAAAVLTSEYPVLASYIDASALAGKTVEQIPTVVASSVRDSIDTFIRWRVFWGVLFLVMGAVGLVITSRRIVSNEVEWGDYDVPGSTSYSSSYGSDYTPNYNYED